MDFYKKAKEVITNNVDIFIEKRLCSDQYVGMIKDFCFNSDDFPLRKNISERPEDVSCIIIILESPHVDEFKGEAAPAKGLTGKNIRKYILEVFGLKKDTEKGLIIINAVQYQCSLGLPTQYLRDKVFQTVWSSGGKEKFKQRLKSAYREDDDIFNCCTKGYLSGVELRKLVQQEIPSDIESKFRRTHPASWHSFKNRKFEWGE